MAAAQAVETKEMNEARPNVSDDGYAHHFQPKTLKNFSSGNRSIKFKDILPQNVSQMITKTIAISKKQTSLFAFKGKSIEIETATCSKFPNGGKNTVEKLLRSEGH